MARKKEKSVSKIKSRGLKKLKLGGGENAKADYDSMIDDGYHAMDDNGAAKRAMNNLKGTGLNPMSPGDVKNALRERVSEPEFDKESTRSPMKNYSDPIKYKTMTPMATDGGFKMSMGSKENFSDSNFSNKDKGTMSAAPSIMKDDWGGETIEMKDQGSPLNYGVRDNVKKERKMTGAENTQAGKDKKSEQKRQFDGYLQTEKTKLVNNIPDFADPGKASNLKSNMRSHLAKYGFNDSEIAQVYDHRILMLVNDAMKFGNLQKAKPNLAKKISKPSRMFSSGIKQDKSDVRSKVSKDKFSRLRKTGHIKDAQDVFLDMITNK